LVHIPIESEYRQPLFTRKKKIRQAFNLSEHLKHCKNQHGWFEGVCFTCFSPDKPKDSKLETAHCSSFTLIKGQIEKENPLSIPSNFAEARPDQQNSYREQGKVQNTGELLTRSSDSEVGQSLPLDHNIQDTNPLSSGFNHSKVVRLKGCRSIW